MHAAFLSSPAGSSSCVILLSCLGKNTLQKHYNGMVAGGHNHSESGSDSTSVASDAAVGVGVGIGTGSSPTRGSVQSPSQMAGRDEAATPGRVPPPASLMARLLGPSLPHDTDTGHDGRTQTLTEDEAMCVAFRVCFSATWCVVMWD